MKARPGQRDALLDILLEAADLVMDLPGLEPVAGKGLTGPAQ
jgi:hypothetical protein